MALQSFEAQVLDLIGDTLAGQIGLDTEQLDDWGTQVIRDILTRLPKHLLWAAAAETELGASSATQTTNVLGVTRLNKELQVKQPAREIPFQLAGRAANQDDIEFATPNDPVFYFQDKKIYVLPTPTTTATAYISAVSYPLLNASTDIAITGFPDELEGTVVLGMLVQVKKLEMSTMRRDGQTEIEGGLATAIAAVSTAAGRINAPVLLANLEFDKVSAILDLANAEFDKISARLDLAEASSQTDVSTAVSAITTAAGRINAAVVLANAEFDLMNPDVDTASASASTNDDIELANVELSVADRRATTGATYLKEASTDLQEAQAFVADVQSRLAQAQAERGEGTSRSDSGEAFIKEAQGRIASGASYLQEAQADTAEAQSYATEVQHRLGIVSAYFQSSGMALVEMKELKQEYKEDIQSYIANA